MVLSIGMLTRDAFDQGNERRLGADPASLGGFGPLPAYFKVKPAEETALKDAISAYTPEEQPENEPETRPTVLGLTLIVAAALAIAAVVAGLWPSSPEPKPVAETTTAAPAPVNITPPECAGQTWPRFTPECLAAKGNPAPAVSIQQKN